MKAFKMVCAPILFLIAGACGNDPEPAAASQDEAPLVAVPIVDYIYGNQIRRSWLMLTADGTLRVHEQHCGGCTPSTSVDRVAPRELAQLRKHIEQLEQAAQHSGRGMPATMGGRFGSLSVRTQAGKLVNVHRIEDVEPSPGDYYGVTYAAGPAAAAVREFVNAQVAMPMPSLD